MKYNINENYGKRAFQKIQEIEKLTKDFNVQSNNGNLICFDRYKIMSSDVLINRVVKLNNTNNTTIVNIYNNIDNNANKTLKLCCNGICVYNGSLKDISLDFKRKINEISIEIINEFGSEVDVYLEVSKESETYFPNIMLEEFQDNFYLLEKGIDETILSSYSEAENIALRNFSMLKILDINLLDIKKTKLVDSDDLYVLGKNKNNELVYYLLSENFENEHFVISNVEVARIDNRSEKLIVYFLQNSKLKYLEIKNDEVLIREISINKKANFVNIFTANRINSSITNYSFIVLKSFDGEMFLVSHLIVDDIDKVWFTSLGFYDEVRLTQTEIGTQIYASKKSKVDCFLAEYDIDKRWNIIKKQKEIIPCDGAIKLAYKEVLFYKNFITIKYEI